MTNFVILDETPRFIRFLALRNRCEKFLWQTEPPAGTDMADLLTEYEFYRSNQQQMVRDHNGKVVVIKGQQVIGVYESPLAAFSDALKLHERGTFLVQRVTAGDEAYTATFYSPAVAVE